MFNKGNCIELAIQANPDTLLGANGARPIDRYSFKVTSITMLHKQQRNNGGVLKLHCCLPAVFTFLLASGHASDYSTAQPSGRW